MKQEKISILIPAFNEEENIIFTIKETIKVFDELNKDYEVGAKLVSFGESILIHIDSIGYWNPQLISFLGFDNQGNRVQLVQHVSQISFLLIALPRENKERPRIGYKLRKELEEEEKQDD